jgi:hypothetical protein
MKRFITIVTFVAAICATQFSADAAINLKFDSQMNIDTAPICIDLSLQKKVSPFNRQSIAGFNFQRSYDQTKPSLKNREFNDLRPNRFFTSNIS